MRTLRLTQRRELDGSHSVEVSIEGDGLIRQTAVSRLSSVLTEQDQEDLRWYLEDYPQYPVAPTPTIAVRIEQRLVEIGKELFRAVFSDDARDLWATVRDGVNDLRIEVVSDVWGATAIPWELIRDPATESALVLESRSFVRAHPNPTRRPQLPDAASLPIRILLVISRPGGGADVPFRSIANPLIKTLDQHESVQLDVLRPATFERLAKVLRDAKADGHPYHAVHFDGHGVYKAGVPTRPRQNQLVCGDTRAGRHGYVLFENPELPNNVEPVDGRRIGRLLVETDVSVLLLNACRSAHADPPDAPLDTATGGASAMENPHAQVRLLGSFAQEVMDAGAAGVLAMRYDVYVVTATRFVSEVYAALARGRTLGEAVALGRKHLHDQPRRDVPLGPITLQDWAVPVVYEAAPLTLVPSQTDQQSSEAERAAVSLTRRAERQEYDVPPSPDFGFVGGDQTVFAVDRAFDSQSLVLLHAFAGSGKTATAAEFGRWYARTGGVSGPVLFTAFEHYRTLGSALDIVGRAFAKQFEQDGVDWLALGDEQRRREALKLFTRTSVLWIWDNVEEIAGFPSGSESPWDSTEQSDLADFLRDVRTTQCKVLLTSRRAERGWLGDLPTRVTVRPMPMTDRLALVSAIAARQQRRPGDLADWRPLLRFTDGNPLTTIVVAGQALREGLRTRDEVEAFIDRLRAGESDIDDENHLGRTRSLEASLLYGFDHGFSNGERKQVSLLHLFSGFVDYDALSAMGQPDMEWSLPELQGLIQARTVALLDRAAEVGLLSVLGNGRYHIHPAVPWFLKSIFEREYAGRTGLEIGHPTRAFVEAMGRWGSFGHDAFARGERHAIRFLGAHEDNLRSALRLAQRHDLWVNETAILQGLDDLYEYQGRGAEWNRLLDSAFRLVADPITGEALDGRERGWGVLTAFRVKRAMNDRQWADAEGMLTTLVVTDRERTRDAMAVPVARLESDQRRAITSLGKNLGNLGTVLFHRSDSRCIAVSIEAFEIHERLKNSADMITVAMSLGQIYSSLPGNIDLLRAQDWIRRAFKLVPTNDTLMRGRCLSEMAQVSQKHLQNLLETRSSMGDVLNVFSQTVGLFNDAIQTLPTDAKIDHAIVQSGLGVCLLTMSMFQEAFDVFLVAIRMADETENPFGAARDRLNAACALFKLEKFDSATAYANAALDGFKFFGDGALLEIEKTNTLLRWIAEVRNK